MCPTQAYGGAATSIWFARVLRYATYRIVSQIPCTPASAHLVLVLYLGTFLLDGGQGCGLVDAHPSQGFVK